MEQKNRVESNSNITFKSKKNEKIAWVKASQKNQRKLSNWLIEAANEKLFREHPELAEKFKIDKV